MCPTFAGATASPAHSNQSLAVCAARAYEGRELRREKFRKTPRRRASGRRRRRSSRRLSRGWKDGGELPAAECGRSARNSSCVRARAADEVVLSSSLKGGPPPSLPALVRAAPWSSFRSGEGPAISHARRNSRHPCAECGRAEGAPRE